MRCARRKGGTVIECERRAGCGELELTVKRRNGVPVLEHIILLGGEIDRHSGWEAEGSSIYEINVRCAEVGWEVAGHRSTGLYSNVLSHLIKPGVAN